MDELEFAGQFTRQGPPTINDVFARALLPDRAEVEEKQAEARRAAERAVVREELGMANRAAGDVFGNVTRCQMAVAEARNKVSDLEAQLADARQVLNRAADQYLDWSAQAETLTAAVARRSDDQDLLAPAKKALAEANVERMLAAPRPEPRGKGRGGLVWRGEPLKCPQCRKDGFTAQESFLYHSDPDTPFEEELVDLSDQAQTVLGPAGGWRAERREGRTPMIYR